MIGNIIQTLYLTNSDYPHASALSILLMGDPDDRDLRLRPRAGHP